MKTPTLIVRLVGLYLLCYSSMIVVQVRQAQAMAGGQNVNGAMQSIYAFAVAGLILGGAGTLFAGPLARLLTFDSDGKKKELDLGR
jgi:hypothetical protein